MLLDTLSRTVRIALLGTSGVLCGQGVLVCQLCALRLSWLRCERTELSWMWLWWVLHQLLITGMLKQHAAMSRS